MKDEDPYLWDESERWILCNMMTNTVQLFKFKSLSHVISQAVMFVKPATGESGITLTQNLYNPST